MIEDLRLLLRVSGTKVFNPQPAIDEALELARQVRAVASKRFKGAEIDLVITREINAITESAERAVNNLQMALEYLEKSA